MASLYSQGEIVPMELPNSKQTERQEGEKQISRFLPTFNFAAFCRYCLKCFLTSAGRMLSKTAARGL